MSITSTSFMAAPGIFNSNLDKIDCSDILSEILLDDMATAGQLSMKGKATNIEHRWIEDALNAVSFTAQMNDSTSITISSPTTTSSVQVILRTGAIVYPQGYDFYVRMSSAPVPGSNVVTVHGSVGTFAAINTATTWYVVAMPKADTSTYSTDISKTRLKRQNYLQVFERGVEIAKTRESIDVYAVSDELALQTARRTMEIKRELSMSLLLGMAKYSSGYTADNEERAMMGAWNFIRDPNLDSTREDTTVVNASSASLSVDLLNTLCYTIWNLGGLDEGSDPILIMSGTQRRKFSQLDASYRRDVDESQRSRVGNFRDGFYFEITGKVIPVITDRWCMNHGVVLLDKSRAWIVPLQGDEWALEKMAKTKRVTPWQLSGQYTLELRNADEAHGLIRSLAV